MEPGAPHMRADAVQHRVTTNCKQYSSQCCKQYCLHCKPYSTGPRAKPRRPLGGPSRGVGTRLRVGSDSELATRSWRLGVGDSEMATRSWRLGDGDSELATRSWRLGVGGPRAHPATATGQERPPSPAAVATPNAAAAAAAAAAGTGSCGGRRCSRNRSSISSRIKDARIGGASDAPHQLATRGSGGSRGRRHEELTD